MKFVRSLLLTVLVSPALVVAGASSALACSCVPPQPDHKAVKDAKAVFTGTMVEPEEGVDIGFDEVTWTFAVDTVYKGDVAERQEVASRTQGPACGVVFKEQKRYAVFAHARGGGLGTNSCMNTRPLADDKALDLEVIAEYEEGPALGRQGQPPSDHAEEVVSWWQLVFEAVAFLVLITGVLEVFRRVPR